MKAAIFDLDGTLYDSTSQGLVTPTMAQALAAYEFACRENLAILVVTARLCLRSIPTRMWLHHHRLSYDRLYMRSVLDRRPAVAIKDDLLWRIRDDGYDPVMAIDNEPDVVQMWRERGIPTVILMEET